MRGARLDAERPEPDNWCLSADPNPGGAPTAAVMWPQYYDLPRVSFRDLVWESMLRGRPGYNMTDLMEGDERHPRDFGHRCAFAALHVPVPDSRMRSRGASSARRVACLGAPGLTDPLGLTAGVPSFKSPDQLPGLGGCRLVSIQLTCKGGRCPLRLCADLLISLLDTAVESLALRPLSEEEELVAIRSLLPPLSPVRAAHSHILR